MKFRGVEITWLGHDSYYVVAGNVKVYIDPYDIGRGRPYGDYILITHSHYDHFSVEDIDRVTTEKTICVATDDLRKKMGDIPGPDHFAKPGDVLDFPDITVEAVPAYNINKKFHPKEEGWLGYIITIGGVRIYHAGDTDFIPEMKGIEADVAMLPVSGTYVMTAEEAAEATKNMKIGVAIPMHYNSIVGDLDDANRFKKLAACKVQILEKKK